MASITLCLKGTKNPSPVYLRLVNGKGVDIIAKTGVFLPPADWDSKKRVVKSKSTMPGKDKINEQLTKLQLHVLSDYNVYFCTGGIIDKSWLESSIKTFFSRPDKESNGFNEPHAIYLSCFAEFWLETKSGSHKVKPGKLLSKENKKQYEDCLELIKEFEGKNKIKLSGIDSAVLESFVEFLQEDKKYAVSTIKRIVDRLKFFCSRAEEENLKINKGYKSKIFMVEEEYCEGIYLNQQEIDAIYTLDLSSDAELDGVRDNFILQCCTGLRLGDLLYNLDISKIRGGIIKIKTQKTGAYVEIPIHKYLKSIISKRFGQLPPKIAPSKYNKLIKVVCEKAKINVLTYGFLMNKDSKRKEFGWFEKYKLISSHVGRSSLATLLKGKVSDEAIMSIAGWSSSKMLNHYSKTSKKERAKEVENYWNNS